MWIVTDLSAHVSVLLTALHCIGSIVLIIINSIICANNAEIAQLKSSLWKYKSTPANHLFLQVTSHVSTALGELPKQ